MLTQTISPVQKTVSIIPANPITLQERARKKKLRVAAYCRVSTDQEEQQSSYQAQIDYYTAKINENKDWTLAGIFADEGITGTSAKKRTEFLKLMKLCEKGKVDLVLTKSISRFSRNTLDCLGYIRKLKEKGIPIIFEKESINTMQMASEMTISLLGSFAQAESESISKNVTWGKRQSFRDGKVTFQYSRFLGYEKGEDGKPKIVPDEAAIVKRIYQSYLSGYSIVKIKEELESEGISSGTGKNVWSTNAIRYMLKNEKYIGDALLQKTYVTDFLTKKSKKNQGEIPQYYVTGNHEGIISKELFNLVQEEIARRASKRKVSQKATKTEQGKYSSKYALSELLVCGGCGARYRRVTWARNGKKKVVWRCINRLEYGTKYCKESPTIEEFRLQDAIMKAICGFVEDRDELIDTLKHSLRVALDAEDNPIDTAAISARIEELDSVMMDLVELSSRSSASADYFDTKFKEISDERTELQNRLRDNEQRQLITQNNNARMKELFEILGRANFNLNEYDEALVKQLIAKVTIVSAEKIQITFKGGFEVEQAL
ncbi:resolvase protein [Clostridiales bacterium oral taxon 876 str. F0540]|nr:resolvase protein [Clostridiales bacterium oral taxon 876 str. F0540]